MNESIENSIGKSKYEITANELKDIKKEKDRLDYPLGHSNDNESSIKKNLRDTGNFVFSMPFLKDSINLQTEIDLVKKRLEKIYQRDENEAYRLNDEYNQLITEAEVSGDYTKLKEFEIKELGMNIDEVVSK